MKKIKLSLMVLVLVGVNIFVSCSNEEDKAIANDPSVLSKTLNTEKNSKLPVNTKVTEAPNFGPKIIQNYSLKRIQNTDSRLLNNEPKDTLIMADPDFIYLMNTRNDFTKKLAQSSLTESEIIAKLNNQQYLELSYAAGYTDNEMRIASELISQSAKRLIQRYNIDTSNLNLNIDSAPIMGAIKQIRDNAGDPLEKPSRCAYAQYTACMILAAEGSLACTFGAGICFAAGSYFCYCSYCTGPIAENICN